MKRLVLLFALLATGAHAQVYKCQVGKDTIYQESPCNRDDQQRFIKDNLTIVDPHPVTVQVSPPVQRQRASPAPSRSASASLEHPLCESLRQRLKRNAARARQRSTESLNAERRSLRDRMWANKCDELSR